MLVMIRWLMTIRAGTMIARWASVADKFSPDLDLRKRLAKSCDRSGKAEGCRKWNLFMESGIDRTYISAVERGIQSPTIRMIVRFANCLKVRPSELVRRMEQSPRYSA